MKESRECFGDGGILLISFEPFRELTTAEHVLENGSECDEARSARSGSWTIVHAWVIHFGLDCVAFDTATMEVTAFFVADRTLLHWARVVAAQHV